MAWMVTKLNKCSAAQFRTSINLDGRQTFHTALSYAERKPHPYQTRAAAHLIAACYALGLGGDVGGEVAQGLQGLADRAVHSPNDARDETLRTRLLIVRARWLAKGGKRAIEEWKRAAAAVAQALKLDAEEPDARLAHAELVRYRIELGNIKGHAAKQLLDQGLITADKALQQQPWNTFVQAARAALWLMLGRMTRDPEVRRTRLHQGSEALTRALQQNHLLEKEYGGLLAGKK